MEIVQLPMGRLVEAGGERFALRHGLAWSGGRRPSLRLVPAGSPRTAYCANCASPIDFGAVWRGKDAYCSVECSLGGDRPA